MWVISSHVEAIQTIDVKSEMLQGSLDIMVQRAGTSTGASRQFTFVKNNYFHDAFFLKALVVNGACERLCTPPVGAHLERYAVRVMGAIVLYIHIKGARGDQSRKQEH